jgi:hypothetical protein
MNLYPTFIFFGLLLIFSNAFLHHPSYPKKEYREKNPILRMIMSESPSSMENDGIWEDKYSSIDGKKLI